MTKETLSEIIQRNIMGSKETTGKLLKDWLTDNELKSGDAPFFINNIAKFVGELYTSCLTASVVSTINILKEARIIDLEE